MVDDALAKGDDVRTKEVDDILTKAKARLLLVLEFYLRNFDKKRRLHQRRITVTRKLHSRSKLGTSMEPEELPSLDAEEVTADLFRQMSRRYRHPVVIRGLLREAFSTRNWSPEHFIATCGDSEYPVVADSRKEDPLTRKTDFEVISVRNLMESIGRGEGFRYLANATRIFVDHPELIREMELHRLLGLLRGATTDECFEAVNIFIGGLGTGSDLHCAFAGNFFNNIVGRKEWILIDPAYGHLLMPMPAQPFLYSDAYFDPGDEELGEFTRRLPSYRVVLEPGDVLYNAPWWWHRVRNLDPFTVGCAVRKSSIAADLSNNPLFTLMCEEYKLFFAKYLFQFKKAVAKDPRSFREVLLRELDKSIYESS